MSSFEEQLIELVRNHEILFDLNRKEYRMVAKKEKIWQEIARLLNSNVDHCKKRWKGLRDTYKRLRRSDSQPSGSAADHSGKKKWQYYDYMTFLDKYADSRATIGNIQETDEDFEELEFLQGTQFSSSGAVETAVETSCSGDGSAFKRPFSNLSGFEDDCPLEEPLLSPTPSRSSSAASTGRARKTPKRRRREDEMIQNDFPAFLKSAANTIKEIAMPTPAARSSTETVFTALAAKINAVNLPPLVVTQLEADVTKLVYDTIAKFQK